MPHSAKEASQSAVTFCRADSISVCQRAFQLHPAAMNNAWVNDSNISALPMARHTSLNYDPIPLPVWDDGQSIPQWPDHVCPVEQPNSVQQPFELSTDLMIPGFPPNIYSGVPTLPYDSHPPAISGNSSDDSSPQSGVPTINYVSTLNGKNEASMAQINCQTLTNSDRNAKPRTGKLREHFESDSRKPWTRHTSECKL